MFQLYPSINFKNDEQSISQRRKNEEAAFKMEKHSRMASSVCWVSIDILYTTSLLLCT